MELGWGNLGSLGRLILSCRADSAPSRQKEGWGTGSTISQLPTVYMPCSHIQTEEDSGKHKADTAELIRFSSQAGTRWSPSHKNAATRFRDKENALMLTKEKSYRSHGEKIQSHADHMH